MSLLQRRETDHEGQPLGLNPHLSSNNPFRNRATSPANSLPSPVATSFNLPNRTMTDRPLSRNPFLDHTDQHGSSAVRLGSRSPPQGPIATHDTGSPSRPTFSSNAAELFDQLNLNEKPIANGNRSDMPPPYSTRVPRSENVPPSPRKGPQGHHPSRSEEEYRRLRNVPKVRNPSGAENIFADPQDLARSRPRLRRNSDSSIASRLMSDEEKLRQERHRKEREARHRDGKGRPPGSKPRRPGQRLDIIDSLDVTSIYGTGLFHHDGPFDACNPERNRKGSRRAPMQAFAKDSANMAIGGSGPVNKNIDINQFHGRGAEGFTDFAASGSNPPENLRHEIYSRQPTGLRNFEPLVPGERATRFDPGARVEQLHGEESLGLGTSTFLDGAPAPRAVVQRRESESEGNNFSSSAGGGLGRKRSLAQKIRGINNSRGAGRITSPESSGLRNGDTHSPPSETQSAGGLPRVYGGKADKNPFFNDYDDAYEKKSARIQIAEGRNRVERSGSIGGGEEEFNARATESARARAMSSPKRGQIGVGSLLERRTTNDGTTAGLGDTYGNMNGSASASGGGGGSFLSRVKSLKGGRRSRPEKVNG